MSSWSLLVVMAALVTEFVRSGNPEHPCANLPLSRTIWRAGSLPWNASLPRGVISVLDDRFEGGADPDGRRDSTKALQDALTYGRTHNVTVFVPIGCYVVTDTLNATEPRNGRWQPTVVIGEETMGTLRRATFVLPPSTPGFTNEDEAKTMIAFQTDWCLSPGADINRVADGCEHPRFPPYNFNQILQGVDVLIMPGNRGAVGITQRGAQGTSLQDVRVFASSDALAGVAGGNGGGGSFVGLTVVGARFGIDMRFTEIPTLVGITLINQTCAGIVYGSETLHYNAWTLTGTGVVVRGSPFRLGGFLGAVDLRAFVKRDDQEGLCTTHTPLVLPPLFPNSSLYDARTQGVASPLASATSLVDSVFHLDDVLSGPCVLSNGSLYLSDVYVSSCTTSPVRLSGGRTAFRSDPRRTHIELLAFGRDVDTTTSTYRFPAYVNGTRLPDGKGVLRFGTNLKPPEDMQSKHVWSDKTSVTWQAVLRDDVNAVDALKHGCKGDGVADDWPCLQDLLDRYAVVVLSKGFYRVSQTLILRRGDGNALLGVGKTVSFIMPHEDFNADADAPLVRVAHDGDDAVIACLTLVTWDHLPNTYALHWSRANGVWRQAFTTRWNESSFPPLARLTSPSSAAVLSTRSRGRAFRTTTATYDRALVVITGGGAFYDFNLDFGCCFGTLIPTPDLPPGFTCNVTVPSLSAGISSLQEILNQGGNYRTLLVRNSTDGLRMYAHNTEQDVGDAHTEIRWSRNVTLYGAKSEGNYVAVWIRDSSDVTVHGYGGDATPFANTTRYPAGRADFVPSLFRVQRSSNVRLANVVDTGRVTGKDHPCTLVAAGSGVDPARWNAILWQDTDGLCASGACQTTNVFDRPVLWEVPRA